jgi:cytoskeletal protein CcmA (bactofilin family)
LFVFGGQVTINSGSTVNGDLIVAGGTVALNGKVNGTVRASGGDLTLNGTVGKNVEIKNGGTVTIGSSAVINGDLNYSATKEATVQNGAQVKGKTSFTKIEQNQMGKRAEQRLGVLWFAMLIGSFLLLWLITLIAPKFAKNFVANSFASPWANLGIGFAVLIAVPVAIILVAITVIGLPIAGFAFAAYMAFLVLAGVLSGLLLGSWIYRLIKKGDYAVNWVVVAIGVIVAAVLKLIPVIGWLIMFGFFLVALGGLITQTFRAARA